MVAANPKKPLQPLTYTPPQAAQAIGCNPKTIYAAIDAGELPYRKGNFGDSKTRERFRIDVADLLAWVDRRFPKVGAVKGKQPEPAAAAVAPPPARRKPRH
jgi:hypothetical protein